MDQGPQTRIATATSEIFVPAIFADGSRLPRPRPCLLGLKNTSLAAPAPELPAGDVPIIPGFLGASGMALLGGMEGTGKSLLALSLACVVAMFREDKEWCDLPVNRTGRVILVFAEGVEQMHKRRAYATCRNTLGLNEEETENVLSRVDIIALRSRMKELKSNNPKLVRRLFVEHVGDGVREFVASELLKSIFADARAINKWAEEVGQPEDRVALIVWDTLQALYGFPLMNDEAINDANQIMNIEHDELGCAGVLLAHTIKSASADDDDPRSSIKGSQQVQATVESVALLRFMNEGERERVRAAGIIAPDHKLLALRFGKFNGRNPERTTRLLRGLDDGAPQGITSLVAAPKENALIAGFTASDMKAATLKLVRLAQVRSPRTDHSAHSLRKLAQDQNLLKQHGLTALKHLSHEGSASSKRKISTFLKQLADAGELKAYRKGNATGYRSADVSDEDVK